MAISGVNSKCYILSLFIRDDGERFVLGDGYYEFKDNQLHFQANTIANDIVEVQGNDGYLLAGQVRRPGTQSFDGYVADGTTTKEETEEKRRAFFAFFRKNYFYKVVYVFADGTAIQRKRGFLVDDPTVSELYQQYPEYHVALNFEDVNYYSYSENDDGEEIFAKEALVYLSEGATSGGLVWDSVGVEWDEVEGELSRLITESGKRISINNTNTYATPIENPKIKGDTFQIATTGKNLYAIPEGTYENNGIIWVRDALTNTVRGTGTITQTYSTAVSRYEFPTPLPAGTYTISVSEALPDDMRVEISTFDVDSTRRNYRTDAGETSKTFTTPTALTAANVALVGAVQGSYVDVTIKNFQLEAGSAATPFEPFTGEKPAPNPDYPQAIEGVTSEQTITFENGQGVQSYNINLGKNLLGLQDVSETTTLGLTYSVSDGTITINGTTTAAGRILIPLKGEISLSSGNAYTLSAISSGSYGGGYIEYQFRNTNNSGNVYSVRSNQIPSTTTTSNGTVAYLGIYTGANRTFSNFTLRPQFEKGSTATDYVQYVTPIELHKIGDYQDYIYKNGDDWYVHKEIGKKEIVSINSIYTSAGAGFIGAQINTTEMLSNSRRNGYCNRFTPINTPSGATTEGITFGASNQTIYLILRESRMESSTVANWASWLASNNTTVYFPLATPTDTQITDTTLISQLNEFARLRLAIGQNLITTNSQGLNAEIELSYRENAPLSGGAIWEEGSGGGPTIVEVDSIDKVYPIWTVTGPAVNPQLSVLSTNTTLRYSGTVTESQTLVIDMFNKTALLNGTSVIGNVSGDWVNFAPGNNRVVYTTNNADANPSKIQWQEVVG